ncbi:MAG TPA: hypothetical protein PLV83_00615 [Bacilli bacterium]|nr:hypothetical protein [Bacilli bacterium]
MKADYEFEEKLFLQFNTEEIDLLDSAITKLKNNTSKIGFRKGVINKEELHVFDLIQGVIKELRQEEQEEE